MDTSSQHVREKNNNSVAFNIDFTDTEDAKKNLKKPPVRVSEYKKYRPSLIELERQQQLATERKKEQEAARLARMQERQEECLRLNAKVTRLLGAEAKKQGHPCTESIPPMSRQEVVRSLREVAVGIGRITGNISKLE